MTVIGARTSFDSSVVVVLGNAVVVVVGDIYLAMVLLS